jgi:hypothetical protein
MTHEERERERRRERERTGERKREGGGGTPLDVTLQPHQVSHSMWRGRRDKIEIEEFMNLFPEEFLAFDWKD